MMKQERSWAIVQLFPQQFGKRSTVWFFCCSYLIFLCFMKSFEVQQGLRLSAILLLNDSKQFSRSLQMNGIKILPVICRILPITNKPDSTNVVLYFSCYAKKKLKITTFRRIRVLTWWVLLLLFILIFTFLKKKAHHFSSPAAQRINGIGHVE